MSSTKEKDTLGTMHVCQIFRFLPMASEQSHNMVYSTVDAVMANPEASPRACFLY